MTAGDDVGLRRFERDGVVACAAMTVIALAVSRRLDVAVGVLGGGVLTAMSYLTIKGTVTALARAAASVERVPPAREPGEGLVQGGGETDAEGDQTPGSGQLPERARGRQESLVRTLFALVKYFTRYALLALAAYVMLTCFDLHPAGLLIGALTPFLAALGQLVRMSRAPSGGRHLF